MKLKFNYIEYKRCKEMFQINLMNGRLVLLLNPNNPVKSQTSEHI